MYTFTASNVFGNDDVIFNITLRHSLKWLVIGTCSKIKKRKFISQWKKLQNFAEKTAILLQIVTLIVIVRSSNPSRRRSKIMHMKIQQLLLSISDLVEGRSHANSKSKSTVINLQETLIYE